MEKSPGIDLKLYTADGGLVASGLMLPFLTNPVVISWGDRIFQLGIPSDNQAEPLKYYEVFAVYLPTVTDSAQYGIHLARPEKMI